MENDRQCRQWAGPRSGGRRGSAAPGRLPFHPPQPAVERISLCFEPAGARRPCGGCPAARCPLDGGQAGLPRPLPDRRPCSPWSTAARLAPISVTAPARFRPVLPIGNGGACIAGGSAAWTMRTTPGTRHLTQRRPAAACTGILKKERHRRRLFRSSVLKPPLPPARRWCRNRSSSCCIGIGASRFAGRTDVSRTAHSIGVSAPNPTPGQSRKMVFAFGPPHGTWPTASGRQRPTMRRAGAGEGRSRPQSLHGT